MLKTNRLPLVFIGLILAVILLLTPDPPHADSVKSSELTFLTLEISDQGIRLVEWNTVPGTIKRPRHQDGRSAIVYEAQSVSNDASWEGGLDDPRIVRLESFDASPAGTISARIIRRDTAQFTIRVPRDVTIHHLAFFDQRRVEKGGRPSVSRTPLAILEWPTTRQGKTP